MQMHRDRHNDSMHAVPIQPLKFISPPRNSWNNRLLLNVTPRRAYDVPRRSHPTWAHDVYGSLTPHTGTRSDHSHPTWAHGHTAHTPHGHTVTVSSLTPHMGTRSIQYDSLRNQFVAHTPQGHTTFTTMQSDFTTCLNNATSITAYLNIATSAAFLNIVCKVHIMMHVIPNALMTNICTYINQQEFMHCILNKTMQQLPKRPQITISTILSHILISYHNPQCSMLSNKDSLHKYTFITHIQPNKSQIKRYDFELPT
jgi:hypothetical protein